MTRFRVQAETTVGLIDIADNLPNLAGLDESLFLEVKPEGDDFPFDPEVLRGESTASGCSAFSGAPGFDTYTDTNGDEQPLSHVTWMQTYQYQGPGSTGEVEDLALWTILRSGMGDGGEAIAGQADGQDTLTFVDTESATATTPGRWRTGDFALVVVNGEVLPLKVSEKFGATLTFLVGIGVLPVGGVTAYIGRALFEDPNPDELGPSCVWYIDSACGNFAWAALGVRSKIKNITRQATGRVMLEVEHTALQVLPRHADNDNSCDTNAACPTGGVAHLASVSPAFGSKFCGKGGDLTAAPFTTDRITGLELKGDFSMGISLPAERLRIWSRRIANAEVDFARKGDSTVSMTFASLNGRVADFDLDVGREARRPFMMPTKPAGVGTGMLLFVGSAMVNSYTHAAKYGVQRHSHEMSFMAAGYHGDLVDGNEAPCANRAICLVLIR